MNSWPLKWTSAQHNHFHGLYIFFFQFFSPLLTFFLVSRYVIRAFTSIIYAYFILKALKHKGRRGEKWKWIIKNDEEKWWWGRRKERDVELWLIMRKTRSNLTQINFHSLIFQHKKIFFILFQVTIMFHWIIC